MKILKLLLVFMFFSSCEEITIIDMGITFKEELVVTGFIGADGQPMVFLQVTQDPMGKRGNKTEIGANVIVVSDQNDLDTLIRVSPNFFVGRASGAEGRSYQVQVASLWGDVSSRYITIPQKVSIDSVRVGLEGKSLKSINVFFQDPPQTNFYAFKALFFDADENQLNDDGSFLLFDPTGTFRDDKASNGRMDHFMNIYIRPPLEGSV